MSNSKELYHKILFFYFQDYIFELPELERSKFIKRGFWGKMKSFLVTLALSQKKQTPPGLNIDSQLRGRRWVFVFGKNNYEATRFLDKSDYVFVSDSRRDYHADHEIVILPVKRKLKYFFRIFALLNYLLSQEGKRTYQIADAVFSSIGWLEAFEQIIIRYQPRAIIFSNDHSFVPRSLFYAAKQIGVPTIYIQHASISPYMPSLEFDLNLLEGEDAFIKYESKGIHGLVKLIGIPRFDSYLKRKKLAPSKELKVIGIAFNTVDSLQKIGMLVMTILREFDDIQIVVRSHPKETRNIRKELKINSTQLIFSDSRSENPFDFILGCHLLIAGDSSIHLEANMLNVNSIYMDLSETSSTYDLYGYIKSGLVAEFDDENAIVEYVRNYSGENKSDNKLIRFYNAALGSDFEGNSTGYAQAEIDIFLKE